MLRVMSALTFLATNSGPMLPVGTAQMLLVIMVVGLGVLLTISIRAKIARRNAEAPSAREQIEAIKAGNTARLDVDAVHASLHDVARKLSAQLDNKAERLEQLIVQAEERIARLETPATTSPRSAAPRSAAKGSASAAPIATPGPHAQGQPAKPQATSVSEARDPEPTDSLRRAIYALADSGRSPVEISRELDEHIGKIELILALRHG